MGLSRFDASEGDESFAMDDSARYTLALLADGSCRVRADCNRMQGAYLMEGERIAINSGAATLAECGPGSYYSQYLRYLTEARQFEVPEKTGQLKLITCKRLHGIEAPNIVHTNKLAENLAQYQHFNNLMVL